ncbi:MAG: DNA primase [Porticoccaceae bacterium]|nr:DNA primase [Porticoccaceae bacterium]
MSGRIPQRFIDDLLDRVDIVDVVGARLDLRKTGKNHSARCPFHDEKTPSFSVNPDKQFYYCFGCGAGGNALGFVMDYDRIDFPRAVETLASLVGMEVPTEGARDDEHTNRRRQLYAVLETADQFYRSQLREQTSKQAGTPSDKQSNTQSNNEAVAYLRHRGLSGEVARTFGIGFAPPGWDNLLALAEGDESNIEQFTDAGLLVVRDEGGKIYDRFRHRVMFPIRDSRGRTIAFGGRVLGDDKPKYLNSPETAVFQKGRELYGLYEASRAGKNMDNLLVVEGYMDVVALAQFDITNAVATLGTSASVEHLEKIFRYTSVVVFCFDGDNAGRKAARRAMETCLSTMKDGRSAKFLFLPDGEDPDTLVRKIGSEAFQQLIVDATPLSTFLFDTLSAGLKLELPDDCARLSQLAAPLINRLPRGVFHQLMIDQLAKKTGMASSTLENLIVEPVSEPESWQTTSAADGDSDQHGYPENYDSGNHSARHHGSENHDPGNHSSANYDQSYDTSYSENQPDNQHSHHDNYQNNRPRGQAEQRHSQQTDKKVTLPPTHWLIALLANNPGLTPIISLEHTSQLSELNHPGMDILLPLIELLRERPNYSLSNLLGYWRGMHGEEQANLLTKIVNTDLITAAEHTDQSSRAQIEDTLTSLLRDAQLNQPIAQQIELLSSKSPLSGEDHKAAVELWLKLKAEDAAPELILAVKQLVSEVALTKQ